MKNFKRLLSVFLLLAMVVSLAACDSKSKRRRSSRDKDDDDDSSYTSDVSSDYNNGDYSNGDYSNGGETLEGESVWTGFSNELKDFGGKEVNILGYKGEFQYDSCQVSVEESNGDPVVDAFLQRNAAISTQLGLKINQIVPESNDDMIDKFLSSVTSGSNNYHALVAPLAYCAPFITVGVLQDINGLNNQYLHLENEWWDQHLMEDITLNDKVYFITGDALVSDDEATWGVLFNKDMIEDNRELTAYLADQTYGGTIYDLVESGKWTLDKMYDMIKLVNNPASQYAYDASSDNVWGMVAQSYDFMLLMQGMEQQMVVKGTDQYGREVPVLRVMTDENVTAAQKLAAIFADQAHVAVDAHYTVEGGPDLKPVKREIFAAGKALFMPELMAYIGREVLRNTDVNYGIVPMPKMDIYQRDYATSVQVYHCAVISIPITCRGEDLDATCYALEAMAFLGNKLVKDEYYERTLTRKNTQDAESAAMLDLIFQRKQYDMGSVYNFNSGNEGIGTLYFYSHVITNRDNMNVVGIYERLEPVFQFGIDQFVNRCYTYGY